MTADTWGLLAGALAIGGMVAWFRRVKAVNIPRDRRGFMALFLAAMAMGIYAIAEGSGWPGSIGAVIAILVGVLNAVLRAQSKQVTGVPAVAVGHPILDFTAPDEQGQMFSLTSLKGTPFLLKFFRGHW
jgi:hypothetical protein